MDAKAAGFPAFAMKDKLTRTALADELLRNFAAKVNQFNFKAKGSGKSGLISVTHCGQEVLQRTACEISEKEITARFAVGFPANGRTINAKELEKILFEYLPQCVEQSFYYKNLNAQKVKEVVELAEDQQAIREKLPELGLAAFVADDSVLPRESGISSKPMKQSVRFVSPETMRVTLELPHRGKITGMGVPKGITLIVGGGYHGKSTLLNALELGVYNHIAGDGREYVIADETAQKLRSEDGRFIKNVDISMFINDLPNGRDTKDFSTADASGSTSQAAGIVEAVEAGSRLLLLDEDTSATNFMVRDAFMQKVVSPDKEPITPFLSRAVDLYEKAGISTILVAGSSGAFFHIADTVIQMDQYEPVDITEKAKNLCGQFPIMQETAKPFVLPDSHRVMEKDRNGAVKRRDYRSGDRAVDRQRADGGTGTAFEIYCGTSGGWKAYHFRNGTVVRTKVRAGRNGICRRAWRYLRWIRNPKNSGDIFLPEPLSGVNYRKNETEYIFIKFLNIEQCKVLCKGVSQSSVKEGS